MNITQYLYKCNNLLKQVQSIKVLIVTEFSLLKPKFKLNQDTIRKI